MLVDSRNKELTPAWLSNWSVPCKLLQYGDFQPWENRDGLVLATPIIKQNQATDSMITTRYRHSKPSSDSELQLHKLFFSLARLLKRRGLCPTLTKPTTKASDRFPLRD